MTHPSPPPSISISSLGSSSGSKSVVGKAATSNGCSSAGSISSSAGMNSGYIGSGTNSAVDHAPSAEETELFEIDESAATPPPHPAYRAIGRPDYDGGLREEIPEADLPLRKRLCTAHNGTYELGESFPAAAARLKEPVRDDLYRSHPGDYTDHRGGGQSEDPADYSSRTHSDLRGRQSPSTTRSTEGGRTTRANPATITTTTTTSVTNAQLEVLIEQGVAKALAARDADRNTNGDDNHVLGTCARTSERVTRECTYPDFMKCKPLNFKGTEGVVDLKKKMTDKYCPRGEIKKLESELWNLRVKSNDVVSYNQRFQELALLCVSMFLEESDKIERYVGGLPDVIYGSVVASRPKTMQEAIEMANELMDKRNNTWAEC
nr:reverse transcriptase domain-containing protein [Tanacetum cinerariifolium]